MTDDGWRTLEAQDSVAATDPWETDHARTLIDWAIRGDCYATGYQSPSKRALVPPKWWEFLILDPRTDSATGLDIKIEGLRWYFDAPPDPAKETNNDEAECYKWLAAMMAEGEKRKRKYQYQDDFIEQFGALSDKAFKRAWAKAVETMPKDSSWRTSGPIRSS